MSKWVQFYHKINKFDLVNMRFTEDFSIVEMTGMDSILPVDGRFNLSSIRAEIQKKIKYNFGNYLEEVHSMMEEDYEEA